MRANLARPIFVAALLASLTCTMASAQGEARPPDVYAETLHLGSNLELLRVEMGRPVVQKLGFAVAGAAPREVYFQAVSLYQKADRLAFEYTRRSEPVLNRPDRELTPGDVISVVKAANLRIEAVKKSLGIVEGGQRHKVETSRTPSDVFAANVEAGRLLNSLLDRQIGPSDVFETVNEAVGYAAVLLIPFARVERIPAEDARQRGARPAEVMTRLLECYDLVRAIGDASGVTMVELVQGWESSEVRPSDVQDVASLVLSELAHFHFLLDDAVDALPAYPAGRRLPSQVHQRAGVLKKQLTELLRQVRANPSWLGSP